MNMDRNASLKLWQIRDVPSSAQSLDQEHARLEPSSPDFDVVSFIGELNRLRGNHLEIRVDPALVAIRKKLKGFAR